MSWKEGAGFETPKSISLLDRYMVSRALDFSWMPLQSRKMEKFQIKSLAGGQNILIKSVVSQSQFGQKWA